jgi:putative IMPACT (imprinted ancient) family translation regulator
MGRYIERVRLRVTLAYAAVDPLRRSLGAWDADVESEDFGEEATLVVLLPRARAAQFRRHVADLTAGRARFEE